MLKLMTWAGLGLSIMGTVVDLARPDAPGAGGDAVEVAMLAKLLMASDPPTGSGPPVSPAAPGNAAR